MAGPVVRASYRKKQPGLSATIVVTLGLGRRGQGSSGVSGVSDRTRRLGLREQIYEIDREPWHQRSR